MQKLIFLLLLISCTKSQQRLYRTLRGDYGHDNKVINAAVCDSSITRRDTVVTIVSDNEINPDKFSIEPSGTYFFPNTRPGDRYFLNVKEIIKTYWQ